MEQVTTLLRTDDRGGLRVCSDTAAVILGGDKRWHHLEECDDGNSNAGDGCSPECTVEPDYGPGGAALAGGDAVPLLRDLRAGPPREGLVQLTPLGATAGRFGWADASLVPSLLAGSGGGGAYRGLYRNGPAVANDASDLDPVAALGDAFVCPCAAATDATVPNGPLSLVVDAGGARGESVLVSAAAGALSEPEGAYAHDGVRCSWLFAAPQYAAARLTVAAAGSPAAGLERLEAAALPGIYGPAGACYATPCVVPLPAASGNATRTNQSALAAAAADSESAIDVLAAVGTPLRITFAADSARALGPARPPAAGGRFLLRYTQGPPAWLRSRLPQSSQALSLGVKRAAELEDQSSPASTTRRRGLSDGPVGRLEARGGDAVGDTVVLLSLAGAPGQPAPCSFKPVSGSALLSLRPAASLPLGVEGLWTGTTLAQAAADGGPLFVPYSNGRCQLADAIGRFSVPVAARVVGTDQNASAVTGEACATLCVGAAGCVFYSLAAAAGDCLLYPFCVAETAAAATTAGNQSGVDWSYATFQKQSRLADTVCSAELSLRARAVRLTVHSCDGDAVGTGRRRSAQVGTLLGAFVPAPASACDPLAPSASSASAAPCSATLYATTDSARHAAYWAGRIRWTGSSRDRAAGDEDVALLALGSLDAGGATAVGGVAAEQLTLYLANAADGPPPDASVALDPYLSDPFSGARALRLHRPIAADVLPLPSGRDPLPISRLAAAAKCRAALGTLSPTAAAASGCSELADALLPARPGGNSSAVSAGADWVARAARVSSLCGGGCGAAVAGRADAAARACSDAWRGLSVPVATMASKLEGGVPTLSTNDTGATPLLEALGDLIEVSALPWRM